MRDYKLILFIVFSFCVAYPSSSLAQKTEVGDLRAIGGFIETSAPNLGMSYMFSKYQGWGWYSTLSVTILGVNQDHVYDNISRNTYDDLKEGEETESVILNVGAVRHVYKAFYLYGGIGYTGTTEYAELNDPTDILGDNEGTYYVETDESSNANLNFGTILKIEHSLTFRLGYITEPEGVSVGVGFLF